MSRVYHRSLSYDGRRELDCLFASGKLCHLSIGVELDDGRLKKIIPRGTQIPCEPISEEFFTSVNNQKGMTLEVFNSLFS